jgi:ribosome-associated translation inhibitor RaiA
MTLQITGKNVDAGDAYQTYVSDKIRSVLKKYLGREYDGHVRLEKLRGLFKTNCSVRLASGLLLEAHGEGADRLDGGAPVEEVLRQQGPGAPIR